MAETADIETSSADYARRFSGKAGRYLLDVQAKALLRSLAGLTPGSVLDVGGGHGQLVDVLESAGWRVTVLGSDDECGRNLRQLHGKKNCTYVTGDLLAPPFADREFDLVVSVRLLSHTDAWQQLIGQMCRLARKSVVFDYPSTRGLNALTPLMFGLKKSLEGNTRTYTSFSRSDLDRALASSSFAVRREDKQFFLPMVVHRATHAAIPFRVAEQFARGVGLTALFGSPVILRADRGGAATG